MSHVLLFIKELDSFCFVLKTWPLYTRVLCVKFYKKKHLTCETKCLLPNRLSLWNRINGDETDCNSRTSCRRQFGRFVHLCTWLAIFQEKANPSECMEMKMKSDHFGPYKEPITHFIYEDIDLKFWIYAYWKVFYHISAVFGNLTFVFENIAQN